MWNQMNPPDHPSSRSLLMFWGWGLAAAALDVLRDQGVLFFSPKGADAGDERDHGCVQLLCGEWFIVVIFSWLLNFNNRR